MRKPFSIYNSYLLEVLEENGSSLFVIIGLKLKANLIM